MITREDRALPADQSPRPPLSFPEQPTEKPPELPRLHFPEQPGGQGPAPAHGGSPPPAPGPWGGPVPPPGNVPGAPPEDGLGKAPEDGPGAPPANGPGALPGNGLGAPPGYGPGAPGAPPDSAPRWGNGPWPAAPGGPARGRPPRPTRPPEPAIRQRAYAALLLATLSVIALLGILSNFDFPRGTYLVIFALVAGLTACWLGVTAIRRARRSASMHPRGAVLGTVFGGIGAFLSAVLLISLALFWRQLTTYSRCLGTANTVAARQACLDQLNHSLNGEISRLRAGR